MEKNLELNQIVYTLLRIQIEFGTYRYGEHLPTIEEMAKLLSVSLDTIRLVYRKLERDGTITLSKSIGTIVNVHYNEAEIKQHIQAFFSERRDIMFDVCHSIPLLFRGPELAGLKCVLPEELYKAEHLDYRKPVLPSYWAVYYVEMVYGALKNELITRLIHRLTISYTLPFMSLPDCGICFEYGSVPQRAKLCLRKDWTALQAMTDSNTNALLCAIGDFYENRVMVPASAEQLRFAWSSYKKTSQLCYSIGLEILSSIVRGSYPVGGFLPSLKDLAEEKKVSVSTIRHAVALLNALGIAKTLNGRGTQILSMDQAAENCDLSSHTVQKRLLDCKDSLQFMALSCRDVASFTISSLQEEHRKQWLEQLDLFEQLGKYDMTAVSSLKYISQIAPYQTIRTVYKELYQHLLWGVPLRGMLGTQETLNDFYRPYHHALVRCLKHSDAEGFASKLEELLMHEVESVSDKLRELR